MTSTGVVASVCARCGEPLSATAERCTVCRGAIARSVLTPVDVGPVASGATVASPGRRAVSAVTTVGGTVVGAALAAAIALPWGAASSAWAALATAIVLGGVQLTMWLHSGRAVGNLVTSTRTVRADDGTALSWGALAFRSRVRAANGVEQGPLNRLLGAATIVRDAGHDPLALSTRGIAMLPPRVSGTLAQQRAGHAVILTFDGRVRIPLVRDTVLGRNPPPVGADAVTVALPDLSRSISKSHVRLQRDGTRVFVEDLGSTNGTQLVTPDGVRDLTGGERVEVPAGAHLLLAGVPLLIDQGQHGVAA